MTYNDPYELKIVMVGDTAVGKTSIVIRELRDRFEDISIPTLGASYESKVISHNGKYIRIQIWDTAGQERFRSMIPIYYRAGDAAIICYDVTEKMSYDNVDRWKATFLENAPPNIIYFLVGNKIDCQENRKVSYQQGEDKAKEINANFFEVSAKTGSNVKELFEAICAKCLEQRDNLNLLKERQKVNLNNHNDQSKKGCC